MDEHGEYPSSTEQERDFCYYVACSVTVSSGSLFHTPIFLSLFYVSKYLFVLFLNLPES